MGWVARISDVIGPLGIECQLKDGSWGRAVPEPFYDGLFGRASAAWKVLRGDAIAFKWPSSDELNKALRETA